MSDYNGWENCFIANGASTVAVAVTPDIDKRHIYTAIPDDDYLRLSTTQLSVTTSSASTISDGQDLMVSDVSVTYNDRTKEAVTDIGTGIVAGAPFGPYGMAVGALGGLASVVTTSQNDQIPAVQLYVCKTDLPPSGVIAMPAVSSNSKMSLKLPVVISLDDTLQTGGLDPAPDKANCWHLLPVPGVTGFVEQSSVANPAAKIPYSGVGWLYRIRLDPALAPSVQSPASYFGDQKVSPSKSTFPYSTCRKVSLDVIWWGALDKAISNASALGGAPNYRYLSYPITVADPDHIGTQPLPKAGDIQFHALCGAIVTPKASNNPMVGDTINAVLQQIKAVQGTQSSASSGTKPTK